MVAGIAFIIWTVIAEARESQGTPEHPPPDGFSQEGDQSSKRDETSPIMPPSDRAFAETATVERARRREVGRKNMLHGAMWFIGGLVIMVVTYLGTAPGETYIVAWGTIVWGGYQFFKGLSDAV